MDDGDERQPSPLEPAWACGQQTWLRRKWSAMMGVFRHTSVYGYKLNHYALAWDPTGTVFVGPANIREQVKLDHGGNTYSGTFTLTQFGTDGSTVLATVTGVIRGSRLTPDTN